jgi:hypothetical protein
MKLSITSLPEECVEMIVDRMDKYSKLCFSITNKEYKNTFYSKEDAVIIEQKIKNKILCLYDCHKLIRKIYDNNVISGWCELCMRETILRSEITSLLGQERVRWVCIDRCCFECVSCLYKCVINTETSERFYKRCGLCGPCVVEMLPYYPAN